MTEELRKVESYKQKPIIAISAAAMKSDIEAVENLFDDYITKPIQLSELANALKTNLDP